MKQLRTRVRIGIPSHRPKKSSKKPMKANKQRRAKTPCQLKAHFIIPLYEHRVMVIVSEKPGSALGEYAGIFGHLAADDQVGTDNCSGFVVQGLEQHSDCFCVGFKGPDISVNTIAHEVLHLTMRLLARNDIEPVLDNRGGDETHAYLAGWITEVLYEEFRKAGIKVVCRRNDA